MKYFDWDEAKNEWLIKNRSISFEMCQAALEQGHLLAVLLGNYPKTHQKKIVLAINDYAYVVPYVEDDEKIFFKTIYPSRKDTKKYLS